MGLSPEERRKIYEEEKARIEAREHFEQERRNASSETSTGLLPNIASFLCYLGWWISGIVFFVLEQKNQTVRFNAAQSIITFGSLTILASILGLMPVVGHAFSVILWIFGFVLWVFLMFKSYNGETVRLSWVADIAEKMAGVSVYTVNREMSSPLSAEKTPPQSAAAGPAAAQPVSPAPAVNLEREIGRKVEEYFTRRRGGRITASAFSIAFSIAALIFFNYFYEYVAYYNSDKAGNVTTWTRTPVFTDDINLWLPVITTALIISIIGHVFLIIYDRYVLREFILMVIDAFSLASVVTLVTVFPFDFHVFPSTVVANGAELGVTITLICVSVGIGIGIMVRGIKLLVNLLQGKTSYE